MKPCFVPVSSPPYCSPSWLSRLLSSQAVRAGLPVQAASGNDGLVTLIPLTGNGEPTRLYVTAVTGNVASLNFEIEQHP